MGAMTEQQMWEIRQIQKDAETAIDFLREHNRFYSAHAIARLLDSYVALIGTDSAQSSILQSP